MDSADYICLSNMLSSSRQVVESVPLINVFLGQLIFPRRNPLSSVHKFCPQQSTRRVHGISRSSVCTEHLNRYYVRGLLPPISRTGSSFQRRLYGHMKYCPPRPQCWPPVLPAMRPPPPALREREGGREKSVRVTAFRGAAEPRLARPLLRAPTHTRLGAAQREGRRREGVLAKGKEGVLLPRYPGPWSAQSSGSAQSSHG
jgi:hypothetical protein